MGIVVRRKDSGESDRRLTLVTKEMGKIDVVAKGARKPASRLNGATEPFCAAMFSFAIGTRSAFLTQAQPLSGFRGLRSDYDRLCYGLALVELFAAVLPFEEPNEQAYDLLFSGLQALEIHSKPGAVSVWVQVALLEISGVLPQFDTCVVCGSPSRLAEGYLSPNGGGYICPEHTAGFPDRFVARHEVLIALSRISQLELPPDHLKFCNQCLSSLAPFWRSFADIQLPANDALMKHLHSERLGSAG